VSKAFLASLKSAAIRFYRWTGTYCEHGRRINNSSMIGVLNRYTSCPECRSEIERGWDESRRQKRAAEVRKMADACKLAMREIEQERRSA
jgi:Pyruvate/2-oxoacid:ferredoxin oxidoreductase gamma subunit